MQRDYLQFGKLLTVIVLLTAGCTFSFNNFSHWSSSQEEYELNSEMTLEKEDATKLSVNTHNGSIKVAGVQRSDIKVSATITGRAETEQRALEIAEQTQVINDLVNRQWNIKVDKPDLENNESVSVSFDIEVPVSMNLDMLSHFGKIRIDSVEGDILAKTHNGAVTAVENVGNVNLTSHFGMLSVTDIQGDVKLLTHNGSIDCENITGSVKAETHFGSFSLSDIRGKVYAKTHNGSIDCENLIGPLDAISHFGAISVDDIDGDTQLTTHNGEIKCKELKGAAKIKTHFGSIDVHLNHDSDKDIQMVTHNGMIRIKTGENYCAHVDLLSTRGSIHGEFEPSEYNRFGEQYQGVIGDGQPTAKLSATTDFGNIRIR